MPLLNIRGIDIDFPYNPYDVQVDYMTKVIEALQTGQNAVLESPTGTGKTLCLLCSTLAWRKAEKDRLAAAIPVDENKLPEGLAAWNEEPSNKESTVRSLPKIIYASRTHSQITQVMKELKRTSYAKSAVVSVLGSREQMCVHPEVSQQTSNQTMIHMCRNKVNKHICHFYNNVDDAVKYNIFTNEVMDIEDLVTTGKHRNTCPYYAAREISKNAECTVIFIPYNYLLDRKSRRSHNLDINGNIIIIDEAHNLEKQCEESASFDISSLDLAQCIDEVGDLLKAVAKLSETGMVADGHEAGESTALSEFDKGELALLKQFFLALEKNLDKIELFSANKSRAEPGRFIFEYFSKVNLTFETYDVLLDLIDKVTTYLSTLSTSFRARGVALQKFSEIIKIVFTATNASSNPFSDADVNQRKVEEASKYYRVHICEEAKKAKSNDIWKKETSISAKTTRMLSYWCFSPGYAMKELVSCGIRNLILTSGTLSPLESFTSELQVDFPITLENDHVIDRHQVFVSSLSTGMNGGQLESTFKSRSDESKVLELGRTIVEVLKLSPGGALVFFPSYSAMTHYVTVWREKSNVMDMCELSKPCTIEPRTKGELRDAIDKFYNDVKSPDGGALFAVCRGKVSEGLDFANDNGRAVIIVGIPYPPSQDPKVRLKMSFLDDLRRSGSANVIQGQEWYRQQACRAVNQAIGRVIRHRYDYGAIVLCDHRYSRKEQVKELPKWIQCHVNQFDDCPKFLRRFKSFFCSVKEKEKLRVSASTSAKRPGDTEEKRQKSATPATQSGQISFAVTQAYIGKFPKANEVDVHIPSRGCPWMKVKDQKTTISNGDSQCSFFDTGKRKRLEENSPCCSSKKKLGLFEVLDENEKKLVPKDEADDTKEFLGEAAAHRLSTQMLVRDKRMEDERLKKKKKIKLKTFRKAQNNDEEPDFLSTREDEVKIVTAKELLDGPPTLFLNTLRATLNDEDYLKFKTITTTYKKNRNIEAAVNNLIDILLFDAQSRELLQTFVRFVRSEHQTRYKELIEPFLDTDSRKK